MSESLSAPFWGGVGKFISKLVGPGVIGAIVTVIVFCCRNAGHVAEEALPRIERAAAKEETSVIRSFEKGGETAIKPNNGFVKPVKEAAGQVADGFADDNANAQWNNWTTQNKPAESPPDQTRFRFPVEDLRTDPATIGYSPDGRFYFMRNNFGGMNGYDARTGQMMMFTAVHKSTRQMHYFNAEGYRTK